MRVRASLCGALLTGALVLTGCGSIRGERLSSTEVSDRGDKPAAATELSEKDRALAHAHYGAGVIHELNGEKDAALEEYLRAARLDIVNEWLVLEVSRRLLHAKQPEKALELLKAASAQPGASGDMFSRLGLVYSQLGRHDEAQAASRLAIKKAPQSLAGYQTLFVSLLQKQQNEAGLKVLNEAAKQPKASPEFLIGLSELYISLSLQVPALRTNATERALALLERAAADPASSAAIQMKLADGFLLLGKPARAGELYSGLLKTLPEVPGVREHIHSKLAEIYLRTNERERATEQLQAVIKADPTNPQAHFFLGTLAMENRKPAEAVDHFKKTVLLSPDFELAYYELASAQMSADQPSNALSTLAEARRKFARSFVLEMLTALAFSQQRAYPEAIKHFTAAEVVANATDTNRLTHVFYFQVGAAYERNGDYSQAERSFRKALELSPDFHEALNYLGYMWAERGENLQESLKMLEKAVAAEPENAAYLDSLAWVLFKLGRNEEALKCILRAVEHLDEPDATVYDHLGDIYAALGRTKEAREAWQKSIEVEPSDEVKLKLQPRSRTNPAHE